MNVYDLVKVGTIGVDAGLCWVGDPCYVIHEDKPYAELGTDWSDFCDKLQDDVTEFGGLGVAVSTGYGDGEYPIYVHYKDGVVAGVYVNFLNDVEPKC